MLDDVVMPGRMPQPCAGGRNSTPAGQSTGSLMSLLNCPTVPPPYKESKSGAWKPRLYEPRSDNCGSAFHSRPALGLVVAPKSL